MIDYETLNQIASGGLKQPNVATTADVSRQNIIDALGIKRPPLPSFNTTPTFATQTPTSNAQPMRLLSDLKEPSKGGIFDVPILGDFISTVEKPSSFIVSTIKEIGDLFVDDQSFSLSEWWNQGQNNIMMGEVFRDWNIGPEGLEGFAFGLMFDIALDPLTYLAGAGLMARASKSDDVARAFHQIGRQAEKAGDLAKAERMLKAEEAVTRSGSILAAGDALKEVGIQSGLRFTIPATGRLGRTLIEKPLRALNPRLGQWLDIKRIGQLSPELVAMKGSKGPLGFLDNVLDTTDDVVQKQIFKRMDNIRNNVPAAKGFDKRIDSAARIAMNMPVEAFKIPFSTGNVLAKGTGALGRTWRGLYATKYGYKIADGLSTKAIFNRGRASASREDRLWSLYGYETMGGADASAGAWNSYAMREFSKIVNEVDKAGADLANIMRGAEMPLYLGDDALGNPLVNQALIDLDPIFGTKEGQRLWNLFSAEGTGYWHRILNRWNDLLPFSGHHRTLGSLRNEFYGPHFLTDEGYRAVKRLGPDDVPAAGERLGPTGLRGSAMKGRRERIPAGIVGDLEADWDFFRLSKDYVRLSNKMGLGKNPPKDTFLKELRLHLNEYGEDISYLGKDNKKIEFNNKVLGQPIRDPEHPLAGGLDARGQADKIGREVYGQDWVEKFATDPRSIFTRYITQMDQTFRTEYVLDAFQEIGIIVRGSNKKILRDTFGSFTDRSAAMFNILREVQWNDTPYGVAKQTQKGKNQGLVSVQKDVDRIAAEINDYENAIAWLKNTEETFEATLGNTVSQLDIEQGRRIVSDFAQIDGLVVDLFASIGALQRGTLKGISPRALKLLEGENVILDLSSRAVKKEAKEVRVRAGLPQQKGLPKQLGVKIPRPQTKTPSAQELVDALRNQKQLDNSYEEAALLIKRYGEIIYSLRAINQAIGDQIGLVGKKVIRTGKEFRYSAGELVDDSIRPKNVRDITQGEDMRSLISKITPDGGTGVTPTEYLTQFQRRIETKIKKLLLSVEGLESKLANNVVNSHPTSVVASLIQDINLRMGTDLAGLKNVIAGIDGPTLNLIRKSLEDLRALGPEAVRRSRGGWEGGLPPELTEELIKYIVGVTKGTGPTAAVQARNLPLDILEQLAVKMGGTRGGGALQQWVLSVKQLEKIYAKIGSRLDNNLVPSLDTVKDLKVQLNDELFSSEEKIVRALALELEQQVAKGMNSPKNRTALAALEGWSTELANIRIAGEDTLVRMNNKWSEALADAVRRGAEKDELLKYKQGQVNDTWAMLKQLREEYDEVLSSPVLKDRISSVDNKEKALKLLNDRRYHAAFADKWSESAQEYLLNFYALGGKSSDSMYQISNFTKNRLKGYSLVSDRAGLSRDQIELFEAIFQASAKTFDPASMTDFQKKYLSLVNWWKAMAISTTGFIWRNTLGGFWLNNQIAGVPLSTHTRVLGIRWMAKRAGDGDIMTGLNRMVQEGNNVTLPSGFKIGSGFNSTVTPDELRMFRDWYGSGVAESGQVTQEVHSVLDTMGSMSRKDKLAKGGTWKLWKAEFYPAAGIRIINQDAEFMLRGAVAHHTMMTGGSVDDAFRQAENFHFNYSDLTNTERRLKMVVPFWTWQKNIIPVLLESMGKNPKAWARLQQVKGELELHSDEEGIVPDFFAENMGIRTPWKWNNDRVYVLPDLPFRDMSRWLKEADNPQDMWKSPARAVVESSLPWFKLPIELWAGKQTFADIPITGRYQQAPVWAEIPVLKQVLQSAGILQTNSNGQLKMRDNHIYMLDQFHPMLARIRRLVPNEEGKQERHFATIINTSLGLGIRMNTPRAQRGQLISDQVEMSQTLRDLRDLQNREI